jgi:hypothetical protein
MERRWGNRVVLDETVTVMRDGKAIGLACLHEVSLSGAFLQCLWRLPQLARVQIEPPRLGTGRRSRDTLVEAFVVRHCTDGLGLEWCDFAPPEVVAILDERRHLPAQRVMDPAYLGEGQYGGNGPNGHSSRRRMR